MNHQITEEHSGYGLGSEITPVCICGWRGRGVGAYNNYQMTMVLRQGHAHLTQQEALEFEALRGLRQAAVETR